MHFASSVLIPQPRCKLDPSLMSIRSFLRHALSRRDLFRTSAIAARPTIRISTQISSGLDVGAKMYESIGVRPVINCRGTLTIIGGSQSLPEVKQAMEEASRHYVHIDELMEAVGRKLAADHRRQMGNRHFGLRGRFGACHGGLYCRSESGTHPAVPGHVRTQERSRHSSILTQCVRPCGSHGWREVRRRRHEGQVRCRIHGSDGDGDGARRSRRQR